MENMHTDLGVEKANIIIYYQPKIKVTGRKKITKKGFFWFSTLTSQSHNHKNCIGFIL